MNRYRRIICAAALLCMLLSLAGCGSGGRNVGNNIPESTKGKDLVASVQIDSVFSLNCYRDYSFNPLIATNHSNQLVCSVVYENMVELDNNFNAVPNIVTAWECNDGGTSWKLTIDTTRTFHDGTPITGKDIRYTIERAINADRYAGRFASFQGVSYDTDVVFVSLGIGDTDFIKLLNIPVIQFGTYGDEYPGGSGPYMYNEEHNALIPYQPYFERPDADGNAVKKTPPINVIYLKEYSTMESNLSAFEDGVIDIVLNDPSSYTNLGYASTDEVHTYATTNMHYVVCNQTEGLLSDSTIRYALNFAFNRNNFVKLLNGNAVGTPVPMYPTCEWYPTTLASSVGFNLQTVKAVFDNAGLKDYDEDGWLEYMNAGNRIDIDFLVCSDSSAKTGVAERFAEDMASLGLKVTVREVTWKEYKADLLEGNFDMYYGEIKLRNNFDITELVQRREKDADEYSKNMNFSGSTDDNIVSYINTYLGASEFEKAPAYRDLCEYIFSSGAFITIGFEKQQVITHRGVCRGIDANAGNPMYGFADWTINLSQ